MSKHGYNPIYNKFTDEIIEDTREFLETTKKSQVTIDTLDLCHYIGKIDNLKEVIDKTIDYLRGMQIKALWSPIYDIGNAINELIRELEEVNKNGKA
jgi:hypothetical protein